MSTLIATIPRGSILYGTHHANSDYDVLEVYSDDRVQTIISNQSDGRSYDIQQMSLGDYQIAVMNHEVWAIETHAIKPELCPFFVLDKHKLRHHFSKTASNSFVKAKKKITVEPNSVYIGLKSLFHSLRILRFGIEFATTQVISFNCRDLYEEVMGVNPDWDTLKCKFQPRFNALASEFRKVCPHA